MRRRLIKLALVLGDTPLVNLMPPGVKQRQRVRLRRRILALCVLASLVVAAASYLYAAADLRNETQLLAVEQARSHTLAAEELSFAGTATVSAQGEELRRVEKIVGSTDIVWAPLLAAIDDAVSAGAVATSISALSAVNWAPSTATVGALGPKGIATCSMVVVFDSIDRLQGIVDGLIIHSGVLDASPGAVTENAGVFSTTITVTFGTDALSNRYSDISTDTE